MGANECDFWPLRTRKATESSSILKNKRLAYLLDQTDEYISSLMLAVKEHKNQMGQKKSRERSVAQNIDPESVVYVKNDKTGEIKRKEEEGAPKRKNLKEYLETNPGWREMTPFEVQVHLGRVCCRAVHASFDELTQAV